MSLFGSTNVIPVQPSNATPSTDMNLFANLGITPVLPSIDTPDNTELELVYTDAPQVPYPMTHQTSHVTHTLSLLHALAFIREIFDDSTVKHIIDDDKQSADRYRQLQGLFMAAVVDNSPDDALNAYIDVFNYSIELCLKNDCDFFDAISNRSEADFDVLQFNRFLNKKLTKLAVRFRESCEDKESSTIEEISEVNTDKDTTTADQILFNIANIVNVNNKVYIRKFTEMSRKVTIHHGFGNTITCYFAGTQQNLQKITYSDLRAKIGNKIDYLCVLAEPILDYPLIRSKSILYVDLSYHFIPRQNTDSFLFNTESDISLPLARLTPDFEHYDADEGYTGASPLRSFAFEVNGIRSGLYLTKANLGSDSVLQAVIEEVKKLVSEDDQAKVKDLVDYMASMLDQHWNDCCRRTRTHYLASFDVNFNLKCTLPSQPTNYTLNTSSSLIELYTDAFDLSTDLSSQPSFISVIDDDKLCNDHKLSSILGDTLTFDSHAISYGLVHEVKVGEKTELYYELTHQINDD